MRLNTANSWTDVWDIIQDDLFIFYGKLEKVAESKNTKPR